MNNPVTLTCDKHNRATDFTVEPMTDDQREAPKLRPCICGATPTTLYITESTTCSYNWCACGSCEDWSLEFHNKCKTDDELYALAVEVWNDAPRATDD